MGNISFEEQQLVYLYNVGTRMELISCLIEAFGYLGPDERDMAALMRSLLMKLTQMSNEDFQKLSKEIESHGRLEVTDAD